MSSKQNREARCSAGRDCVFFMWSGCHACKRCIKIYFIFNVIVLIEGLNSLAVLSISWVYQNAHMVWLPWCVSPVYISINKRNGQIIKFLFI